MDKRLMTLLRNRGGQIKDGCMIDSYNQQIQYDVSCTIRTNINTANHHFIVEECNSKENISTPTKVSIGTQRKSSSEDNLGGISRTVKTDDSLAVMEGINNDRCIQVGNIYPDSENMANRPSGRVNSTMGCSPTILSRDFKQPKMIMEEPKAVSYTRDSKGKTQNKHLNEIANTIHSSTGSGGNTDCFVAEPIPLNPYKDGTCRTIKAQYQQSSRAKFARQDGLGATGVVQIGNIYPDQEGFKNRTAGRIYSADGLSPTLRTMSGGHQEPKIVEEEKPKDRIRKLTCREVFRLMDVDDADIDKIQAAGISNSQQYKLAGNSIVVSCLYHLFRKMFVETENESQQLTLF